MLGVYSSLGPMDSYGSWMMVLVNDDWMKSQPPRWQPTVAGRYGAALRPHGWAAAWRARERGRNCEPWRRAGERGAPLTKGVKVSKLIKFVLTTTSWFKVVLTGFGSC